MQIEILYHEFFGLTCTGCALYDHKKGSAAGAQSPNAIRLHTTMSDLITHLPTPDAQHKLNTWTQRSYGHAKKTTWGFQVTVAIAFHMHMEVSLAFVMSQTGALLSMFPNSTATDTRSPFRPSHHNYRYVSTFVHTGDFQGGHDVRQVRVAIPLGIAP
jgi:hypothetical protein